MAAKIGILGEVIGAATAGVETKTVYTVPANKAAKVRLMIGIETVVGGSQENNIQINGMVIWSSDQPVGASAKKALGTFAKRDGGTGAIDPDTVGLYNETGVAKWADDTTADDLDLLMPLNVDYYLSAGDTVSVSLEWANDHYLAVVGVEDDA